MPFLAARLVVSLAVATLAAPVVLGAQTLTGIGERAQGMGGAFAAVADDASAVYWNPAGLAWPTGSTFDAQLDIAGRRAAAGPGARSPVWLAAVMPPLGIAYYRLAIADDGTLSLPTVSDSAGRQDEGLGEVRLRTLTTDNFGVTVNQTVVNGLVIGSTFRLVRGTVEQIPGRSAFDLDLGALVSMGSIRVGAVARNLRQPEFPSGATPFTLERQVRVGAALVPRTLSKGVHGPFSVAFDADLTRTHGRFHRREAAIGGEYWVDGGAAGVRAGVRWSTLGDPNPAFSSGLTVKLPHSFFAEGHLTKFHESEDLAWGLGVRVTF